MTPGESAFKAMFHEARGAVALDALSAYLERQAEEGALRDDLDPKLVAAQFLCLAWHHACGVKVFKRPFHPPASDEEAIATFVSIFVRGLRP